MTDLLPCPDVDALLAREMQITLTMFRNRGEPLKASEIMTQVSTEKFAQIMEFALRHYNSAPNKPAALDAKIKRYEDALHYLIERADDSNDARYGTLSAVFVRDVCSKALDGTE